MKLLKAEKEQLDIIQRKMFVEDGDLVSKAATKSLLNKGLIERLGNGYIISKSFKLKPTTIVLNPETYKKDINCEDCGKKGAYDILGDYLCHECVNGYNNKKEE